MSFRQNIIKARSHIAFCIGLCLAASFALNMETGIAAGMRNGDAHKIAQSDDQTEIATTAKLKDVDLEHARVAWAYFEQNLQPETGLVNSVNNFPSTTIWDQASYLLGLISAQRIGLIDQTIFDERMSKNLTTLANLPLFDGKLPNKVYDTRTLDMTNYANKPVERGIGWSALDIARITVPLNILLFDYPEHAGAGGGNPVELGFFPRCWMAAQCMAHGSMKTATPKSSKRAVLVTRNMAPRAVNLLGLDAMTAAKYDDYLDYARVAGQSIAIDSRSFSEFDAHNYVVSEPYILTAVEFGLDSESQELAHRIYTAQHERFNRSGIITAVSER